MEYEVEAHGADALTSLVDPLQFDMKEARDINMTGTYPQFYVSVYRVKRYPRIFLSHSEEASVRHALCLR